MIEQLGVPSVSAANVEVASSIFEEVRSDFPDNVDVLKGLTGYINAGGHGTRLSSLFKSDSKKGVSKALLSVGQPPITLVEHHINKLSRAGITTIIAGVGDHDNVAEHVMAKYSSRAHTHALHFSNQLGNGGDLVRAVREQPELFEENVLITCADTLLDLDEAEFYTFHLSREAHLSIAVTLNSGVPNEGAYYIGNNDQVVYSAETSQGIEFDEVVTPLHVYRASSTGALIANRDALASISWQPDEGPLSLYGQIVRQAIETASMYAFNNGTRLFTDVGTVASWNEAVNNHEILAPHIYYEA